MSFLQQPEARRPWDGGDPQQPLENLKERHAEIARLLVQGWRQVDIAKLLGVTQSRLSIIIKSPAFQEHIQRLSAEADDRAIDVVKRVREGAERGVEFLLQCLDDETEVYHTVDNKTRVNVAQDLLDRDGRAVRVARSDNRHTVMHVTSEDLQALTRRANDPDLIDLEYVDDEEESKNPVFAAAEGLLSED